MIIKNKNVIFVKKLLKIKSSGFTLVEIMIVVAIIMLITATSIPNLLRIRHNANETAALKTLRTLSTVFEEYRSNQVPPTYPPDLAALANVIPPYIDSALGAGTKQGYTFTITDVSKYTYTIRATPVTSGVTGTRIFEIDQSGEIAIVGESADGGGCRG